MRYNNISWNLNINKERDDMGYQSALDTIANSINNGYTEGSFDIDCTDYDRCEDLKNELELELGRDVDFNVENDDTGELYDLLDIATENNDNYVIDLITDILDYGFGKNY